MTFPILSACSVALLVFIIILALLFRHAVDRKRPFGTILVGFLVLVCWLCVIGIFLAIFVFEELHLTAA